MRYWIGVDDTDNLGTRQTGYHARQIGEQLRMMGVTVSGITRHQLLVDPRIHYTSHNSSVCLAVEISPARLDEVAATCREYLREASAPGADAGLCFAPEVAAGIDVQEFGRAAKRQVLTRDAALDLARHNQISIEGVTGNGGGVIGAIAAVGLRAAGNDGRFLWVAGVRELSGVHSVEKILQTTGVDEIRAFDGSAVPESAKIEITTWPHPLVRDGRAVLFVEEVNEDAGYQWRVIAKTIVRRSSQSRAV